MAVDTRHVKDRRRLHFASIQDALRDAEGLASAESAGRLVTMGNWTLGQAFGHLAGWMEFALDGYPRDFVVPWYVRAVTKIFKRRFLSKMPVGMRMPKVEGGTLCTRVMPTNEGLERLCRAWERLGKTAPTIENPAMGPLTHDEWIALNLRHAELHQGFFRSAGDERR